jgi:hypothetical protein
MGEERVGAAFTSTSVDSVTYSETQSTLGAVSAPRAVRAVPH